MTQAKRVNGIGNPEPLRAAINKILADPKCWDQSSWHCNTKHCFGGHIQINAGLPETNNVESDLCDILDADDYVVGWLCEGSRFFSELYEFSKATLAGEKFWDRAGRDRDGFDRAGFDRAGFDRDGFDRAGRDRDGRDRDGFDRAGRDRAGFDRDGFDRAGFDRAGNQLPPL